MDAAVDGSRMGSELSVTTADTREAGNITSREVLLVGTVSGCALMMVTPSRDVVIAKAAQAADVLVDLMTFDLWFAE